jgi:DNA-binding MarR family transcriptional regulator
MAERRPAEAPSSGPVSLDDDLGWMLGVVFRSYVKGADTAVSDLPGGPRGYQVLTSAVQDGACNQGTIALRLGIDRTVLTYLIDDLEHLDLVERRPDPSDRRSRLVEATDNGRAVWAKHREALGHLETQILGALAPDDAARLRTLLRHVACRLQALDPPENLCEVVQQAQAAAPAVRRSARAPARGRAPRRPDPASPS